MIEKLNRLRHLKVTSRLKKDSSKEQKNNSEQKNRKKEDKSEEKPTEMKKLLTIEEVLKKLNDNHYYKKKDMTFQLLKSNDGNTVTIMSKGQIIKRLEPSEVYQLFDRVSLQDEDSPIKGGILNINI